MDKGTDPREQTCAVGRIHWYPRSNTMSIRTYGTPMLPSLQRRVMVAQDEADLSPGILFVARLICGTVRIRIIPIIILIRRPAELIPLI